MLWSDKSLICTFGIASSAGMILGSLAYSLAFGRFRWEGFADVTDTRNPHCGRSPHGRRQRHSQGAPSGRGNGAFDAGAGVVSGAGSDIAACWGR